MGQTQWKGVTYESNGSVKSCLFCQIAQKKIKPGSNEEGVLLYEDDDVVVFRPRQPMATRHVLAVPKRHVKSVNDLKDRDLLEKMLFAGSGVLDREVSRGSHEKKSIDDILKHRGRLYRFHVPPFNSIDHVHLHCFEKPFLTWYNALKYADNGIWSVSAGSVRSSL